LSVGGRRIHKNMSGFKLREIPYHTPDGYVDFPFTYVFDATSLADGVNQGNLTVPLQGDSDFVLRHIAGVDTCVDTAANGGKFNLKNSSGSYANAGTPTGIIVGKNWPVVPEKVYKYNTQIGFDLFATLRSTTVGGGGACAANPVLNSFIAFFGVKRFPIASGWKMVQTPYRYREVRYSYEVALTISQGHFTVSGGGIVTPPQRVIVSLDSYDFELLRITISQSTTPAGQVGTLLTNDFQVMLYDPNNHQLSNIPLNQGFINSGRTSPSTAGPYQGCWPVPSIVYPAGGNIIADITSMLCAGDAPRSYNISFEGIWRLPC
jgi:hypothetical protein